MATETGSYVESVENLLSALEIYRDVEQKAIQRIDELLKNHGIMMEPPKVSAIDTEEIKAKLQEIKQEKEVKAAMVAEEEARYEAKQEEEEVICRR